MSEPVEAVLPPAPVVPGSVGILGGTFEAVSIPGEGATIRVFLPRWTGPAPEVAVDAA